MAFLPRFVIALTVLLVVVLNVPYVVCSLASPPGWQYLGFTADAVDQHPYISFMNEARGGRYYFNNLYTPEMEPAVYTNLFWWLLGSLARLTTLPSITVFHGARLFFNAFFLLLLWRWLRYHLSGQAETLTAWLWIAAGTGWGWLSLGVAQATGILYYTADMTLPEGFGWISMLWKPHFVYALCLQIGLYWCFQVACERSSLSHALAAAGLTVMLGFSHGFHLATVYLVVSLYSLLLLGRRRDDPPGRRWRPLACAALIIFSGLPAVYYFFSLVRLSPLMKSWGEQNICLSPPVWAYLLGFGPLLLPLMLCPRLLWRSAVSDERRLLLWVWLLGNSALLYTGGVLQFERRLVQGLQMPLALLSTLVFFTCLLPVLEQLSVVRRLVARGFLRAGTVRPAWCLLWLLTGLPVSLWHLTANSFIALPPQSPGLFYLAPGEQQAVRWLRHTAGNAVIAAPEIPSAWLPRETERRVVAGHPMQTPFYGEKIVALNRFFSGRMQAEARDAFLQRYGVTHIYLPRGSGDISLSPAWRRGFTNSAVDIYVKK